MISDIEFNPAAFRHGISEANIKWAIKTHIYDGLMEGFDNKYALIGFDTSGNLLEIMYNVIKLLMSKPLMYFML
jgi:hypothetical protein